MLISLTVAASALLLSHNVCHMSHPILGSLSTSLGLITPT